MSTYLKLEKYLSNNQSTWLITGVAGFIGSNLLEKLLVLNQKVIGLDNFVTGYQHNIDQALIDAELATGMPMHSNFKLIKGDIRNIDDCRIACEKVNYVLHQAALGSVPRSISDPVSTNQANVDGFLNMLIASKDAKVKNFVYAASSSTYGDSESLPKIENNIGNPLSPYAVTKLVNELYAGVFAKTFGLKSIGLRYFNIFGKRQDPSGSYAAVIPKWISAILNNKEVFINGDGETTRDFCYIENAVQMNLLAATTKDSCAINEIYNVALNDQTSLNELYVIIFKQLKSRLKDIQFKEPIYQDFRVGDVRHSLANIDKAIKLLNYHPKYKINDGINETVDWYLKTLSS